MAAIIAMVVGLAIAAAVVVLMVRMNRAEATRIRQRREAWYAEGNEGPPPGERGYISGGGGNFFF